MSVLNNTFIPSLSSRALRPREALGRVPWVITVVVAFFLLLWEQAGNASFLRTTAAVFTQPSVQAALRVQQSQEKVSQWWLISWQGAGQLAALENEVRQLQVDTDRLERLEKENSALRSKMKQSLPPEKAVAQWYGSEQHWFIDLGCGEGVFAGSLVTADGAFVGIVEESYPFYSSIRAWDDPSWRLATKVGTESAYGVFSFGRSIPEVEEIPRAHKESVRNAAVVTAGQEEVPPNYLLGSVQEVVEEPGFGTVRLLVTPVVDLHKLLLVEVEIQSEETCSD